MKQANTMFQMLSDDWFLREPAFFALYCQQQLEENVRMDCAVRCGQGRLEYNPLILKHKNYAEFEQLVRIELIRLFLKHPYEREPDGCSREAMSIGSNVTIADGYCTLHKEKLPLQEPGFYHLPMGMYYEWYAKEIQKNSNSENQNTSQNNTEDSRNNGNSDNDQNQNQKQEDKSMQDLSSLWREDSMQRQRIDDLIERTTDWGSIPAEIVEKIKATTKARISNRLIWQGFKSAVICSKRLLTRMKPNRRTGFLQMGNTRQFSTRLLIAIDVSGSITTEKLEDFYSSVNRLFRYGTTQIDLCQFDAEISSITEMKRAKTEVTIKGRGGTSYQPIIDHIADKKEYDGLIILTDGQAPQPILPKVLRTHILWVCQDKHSYEAYHEWMEKSGRCCHL